MVTIDVVYPPEVKEIATKCAAKYKSNIDKGVADWLKKVQKLDGFDVWSLSLIEAAGRKMIGDSRHETARKMRKASGYYGTGSKVDAGQATFDAMVETYFDYPIDGRRLGDITFEELVGIANDQEAKADGFMFNARLCRALYAKRPKKSKGMTVEKGVKEATVERLFSTLGDQDRPMAGS